MQQNIVSIENNFTKGLITESTGLNFPENAATDTDNCEYTLVGDVLRRKGIDWEDKGFLANINPYNLAINTYKWNNAGGDGFSQILVVQVGASILFYLASAATDAFPLSTTFINSNISIGDHIAFGAGLETTKECQFADGNGYLFIYHPNCDPIYCTYSGGLVKATSIDVKIRDFTGVTEPGVDINVRPSVLTVEHNYNLTNQGWVKGNAWAAISTPAKTLAVSPGQVFVIPATTGISNGQQVTLVALTSGYIGNNSGGASSIAAGTSLLSGTVTGYAGTNLTLNITGCSSAIVGNLWLYGFNIIPRDVGFINTWFTAVGNYPSNADVWWYFRNSSNVFDPATTNSNVTLASGRAPQGHYILNAFNQQKAIASGLAVTDITTVNRPTNGCWFQGRVWYTGINATQVATGDANFYTWTENIYFSKIVTTVDDFGLCYQTNDPTSDKLFDILPTDGGVISIPGCGNIYKLFPIQNGLLVFASLGVWFITGSQGIGFAANDYTITKLSAVHSISSTSFVDVQGLPYFWNEDGIYAVQPQQGGGLAVNPLTVGTILSFYNTIPVSSKQFVRGAYHPLDYTIQWVYRDTDALNITQRYQFNKILNYNTYNKAFYPYSISNLNSTISGIDYISNQGGVGVPLPTFKYLTTEFYRNGLGWSEERDTNYVDFASIVASDYTSYFVTGYKLRGQAIKRFQPQYVQVYSRTNGADFGYKIQGLWDFANNRDSGRWTNAQVISSSGTNYDTIFRRHKIRGHGYALQFKISSISGKAFDIQGWAVTDMVNAGT